MLRWLTRRRSGLTAVACPAGMVEIVDDAHVSTNELLLAVRKCPLEIDGTSDQQMAKVFGPPPVTTVHRFLFEGQGDKEFAGRSPYDLHRSEIVVMNVRERLMFELRFLEANGHHPDNEGTETLCPILSRSGHGARFSWRDGKLWIKWCSAHHADPMLRARRAFPVHSHTRSG